MEEWTIRFGYLLSVWDHLGDPPILVKHVTHPVMLDGDLIHEITFRFLDKLMIGKDISIF